MTQAPVFPDNETERLLALRQFAILDTPPEQAYDDITAIAAQICDVPITLVSLVDTDRQWFKSIIGIDASETPRDISFCGHAILEPAAVFHIPDATQDARFANNPLVTGGPRIRLYAGAPLVTHDNHVVGTLCVIDTRPRQLDEGQLRALQALARQVVAQMELRRALATMQRSNEDLENFAGIAAHDLRAPLRGIEQLAGFIEDDAGDALPDNSRHDLARIRSRCARLSCMLSALLAYSRIDAPDQAAVWVDTHALIMRLAEMLDSGGHFVVALPQQLPRIYASPVALELVFSNILANAIKHHDRDTGTITIEAHSDAEFVHFTVIDDGPGIPEGQAQKVFNLFATLKPSDHGESVGMGLALVDKSMQHSGGKVALLEHPGRGAHFRLSWPNLASA